MSSDELALLWSVCGSPDDDTPRLVYADWLEEHARPERAEFIRCQCWRARPRGSPEERTGWLRRSIALFRAHGQQFLADDWPESNQQLLGPTFDRGFVAELALHRCGLDDDQLRQLTATRPLLALVRTLGLCLNQIGDDGLRAIASCPRLGRLVTLDISGNPFTDAGVEALAASPHLVSLAELHVGPILAPLALTADPTLDEAALGRLIREDQARRRERAERRYRAEELFLRHGKSVQVNP
jgi:uncharacterized protein (TIGR02996 family)